jgi:hypothetical protein
MAVEVVRIIRLGSPGGVEVAVGIMAELVEQLLRP